jgi:hypothetical protein
MATNSDQDYSRSSRGFLPLSNELCSSYFRHIGDATEYVATGGSEHWIEPEKISRSKIEYPRSV